MHLILKYPSNIYCCLAIHWGTSVNS
jgi:hypothetical protein